MGHADNAGTLELKNVGKSYSVDSKALEALQGIDLAVGPGQFVCLVGPSGCGKSTILRLIIGLDTQYNGDILLDGKRISGPGAERSIVFQEHRLLPWLTVEDNIGIGLDRIRDAAARRRLVADHIALVGLQGFERAFPHQLSGGMAQRAAIARGLVTQPEILLLDEPLGALDSLTRSHLQQELRRIWRQQHVTMVMVTHDVEEAVFLSDQVVVMSPRPGRIRSVIPIDLPPSRSRSDPHFIALRDAVLRDLTFSP